MHASEVAVLYYYVLYGECVAINPTYISFQFFKYNQCVYKSPVLSNGHTWCKVLIYHKMTLIPFRLYKKIHACISGGVKFLPFKEKICDTVHFLCCLPRIVEEVAGRPLN